MQRGARSIGEFCRARAVALRSSEWSVGDIAEAVDVTAAAVYGWLKRFGEDGVEALRDRGRPGRPPKHDDRFRARICRALSKSPRRCGLVTTVWIVLTLAVYLFGATSRMISRSHLRQIIRDEGSVWRRPKLSLKWRHYRRLYRAVEKRLGPGRHWGHTPDRTPRTEGNPTASAM